MMTITIVISTQMMGKSDNCYHPPMINNYFPLMVVSNSPTYCLGDMIMERYRTQEVSKMMGTKGVADVISRSTNSIPLEGRLGTDPTRIRQVGKVIEVLGP